MSASGYGQEPRARDLGVPFAGEPGPLNAITDVAGVEVGHVSIVEGEVRTGATALFPRNTRDVAPTPVGLEQKIARIVFDASRAEPSGAVLGAGEIAALVGDYEAGVMRIGIDRVGVVAREGGIAARFGGVDAEGPAIPLIHLEGRHFLAAHDDEMAFIFAPDAGEAQALTVDWLGGGIPFVRTDG